VCAGACMLVIHSSIYAALWEGFRTVKTKWTPQTMNRKKIIIATELHAVHRRNMGRHLMKCDTTIECFNSEIPLLFLQNFIFMPKTCMDDCLSYQIHTHSAMSAMPIY